jgi:replication-associated recombination protein RarA
MRTSPNVIITGTPGVGKTVHCEQLAQETGLKHLQINQVAKDRDCHDGFDQERQSWIVDEDKVREILLIFCESVFRGNYTRERKTIAVFANQRSCFYFVGDDTSFPPIHTNRLQYYSY